MDSEYFSIATTLTGFRNLNWITQRRKEEAKAKTGENSSWAIFLLLNWASLEKKRNCPMSTPSMEFGCEKAWIFFFFLGSSHHPLTHSCWTETKRKKNKNIIINIKIQLGLVIFFSNSMIKPTTGMHILRITSVIPVRPTVTLCAKSDSKVTDFLFKFFLRVDFSIDWCNKLSLRHVFLKLETSRIFFHVTPLKPWPFPFSFSRRFFSLSFPFTHEIL